METEDEIKGKAYVHWRAWHEAYPDLVSQEYLNQLTLEKCEAENQKLTLIFNHLLMILSLPLKTQIQA
jgi:hypothetical protein